MDILSQATERRPQALIADFETLQDELEQIARRAKRIDFRSESGKCRITEPTIIVRGK